MQTQSAVLVDSQRSVVSSTVTHRLGAQQTMPIGSAQGCPTAWQAATVLQEQPVVVVHVLRLVSRHVRPAQHSAAVEGVQATPETLHAGAGSVQTPFVQVSVWTQQSAATVQA